MGLLLFNPRDLSACTDSCDQPVFLGWSRQNSLPRRILVRMAAWMSYISSLR